MQSPTIASVKEQIESYRKTRTSRRQRVPDEIISNIRQLSKFISLSKLQREFKLGDSVIKKVREQKPDSGLIRLAPVTLLNPMDGITLDISSPRGESISVRGLSSTSQVADLLRALREG
jgi:hypothetical protein